MTETFRLTTMCYMKHSESPRRAERERQERSHAVS